ncbi:AP-3 complex subunit sigma-2 isoform X1 [Zalophus californianus]|uniref:AP-3 complex subunit sigma-2 isoform X1 n=1 Tax=Zalophus californianus TaxID=9704 RepID=A0A6J2B1U6_ZALCA|nr:AP-3 complex subunit sigma-2 isoform X1 [Zalophus californianus]XP_027425037.1 AP-3 complex subunit sigma-2 isoform X1 [Zalophus californianus]XP_027977945.1 AP-3 complex subunit sigma-2 isoform X1 [Eumetopias jubatus]XP_027977946.1 AP-3 complex subunit sigma-2 isoform X1 [Eumetopias jubatus]
MTTSVTSWRVEGSTQVSGGYLSCSRRDPILFWKLLNGCASDTAHFDVWFLGGRQKKSLIGGPEYKLIYRHYATLYFVFCVDSSESELGILDLIQVFVETLDKCFENVCELDLIFHMDKVHYILQEVVMGGMVLETNMNEIVAQIEAQNRLEKSEGGLSAAPARAVSAVKNINLPEIPRNINIGDLNIKVPNLSQFV